MCGQPDRDNKKAAMNIKPGFVEAMCRAAMTGTAFAQGASCAAFKKSDVSSYISHQPP